MKTKLFALLFLISGTIAFAQYTAIPDANFENALLEYDDVPGDGQVPTANIENLTSLEVNNQSITDLTGIEDFVSLVSLNVWGNQIASIDFSQNTALEYLQCGANSLSALDLSENTSLVELDCSGNYLPTIILPETATLTSIICANNEITELDLTQLPSLTYFDSWKNNLTSLDVSQNTAFDILYCANNDLTSLDVSQNANLTKLSCSNNDIVNLDLSQNAQLQSLQSWSNQLETLNLKNGNTAAITDFNTTNNPNLECIQVDADIEDSVPASWLYDAGVTFSEDCGYLGIGDNELANISIFPNPASSIVTVVLNNSQNLQFLELYSVGGKKLLESKSSQLNISKLPVGVYLLNIITDAGTATRKVIKQ